MKHSSVNLSFSNTEVHSIKAIQFGLLNPEDIVKIIANYFFYYFSLKKIFVCIIQNAKCLKAFI